MILSCVGAAIGSTKSGIGISGIGTFKPELIMKSLIPVVLSGILSVYGLVVSVLIAGGLNPTEEFTLYSRASCTWHAGYQLVLLAWLLVMPLVSWVMKV